MLDVVKLLDKIEHFYQEFVKDVIEQDALHAIAGYVFALLEQFTFSKVELEEIDTENNRIVFSIKLTKDGNERVLKLEIHAKVPPKITLFFD